jgi:osmotically-inducible protein OsmY
MVKENQKIRENVLAQLYWDQRVDATNIKVEVENDTIKLHGVVPTIYDKKTALEDTWKLEDIKKVDNQIIVEHPPSFETPDDSEIKRNIKIVFSLDKNINADDIKVSVDKGIVTLEGVTDSYWKKIKAVDITSEVGGVLEVIDKITIVPTEKRKDKEIAKDIMNALSRNSHVIEKNVDVEVNAGIVTLTGIISDQQAYRSCLSTVHFTEGVVEINDNLAIEEL